MGGWTYERCPGDGHVRCHGTTGIQLSDTDRPADALRAAASVLERLAASIEREEEPIACATRGASPAGIRAAPSGSWELFPCGQGLPVMP